jgi:protein gp37
MATKIEYLDETWNPVSMTCSRVSTGCKNCWHLAMVKRFGQRPPADDNRLSRWKKPRIVGVQFMGDLFHEGVADGARHVVWDVMIANPRHTFLLLTKRPTEMLKWLKRNAVPSNVWVGVSAENQSWFNRRWGDIQNVNAPVRWVSVEPMLGPIDMRDTHPRPDWIVIGAESGPDARRMQREWAENLIAQCDHYAIPVFYKQGPDNQGNPFLKMPWIQGQRWDQYPTDRRNAG